MAALLNEVHSNFDLFIEAFEQKDFNKSKELLLKVKAMLVQLRSLPPLLEHSPTATIELETARDIYEHAVVLSLNMEDEDAFETDFLQLKPYYHILPPSPQQYPIISLNLLRLLVQNRIDEFHDELEILSCLSPIAMDNPCIKHAVELEKYLYEEGGGYTSVLLAREALPGDRSTYTHANYFMDLLEIYITEEEGKPDGGVENAAVFIEKAKESAPCKEIPSLQIINQLLNCAKELD